VIQPWEYSLELDWAGRCPPRAEVLLCL